MKNSRVTKIATRIGLLLTEYPVWVCPVLINQSDACISRTTFSRPAIIQTWTGAPKIISFPVLTAPL